jgi:glucose-6-phosphate isomerase
MSIFRQYKAYKNLQELASNPFDLTHDGNLSLDRVKSFQIKSDPFTLLYATERVNGDVIKGLLSLADEAKCLEKMVSMQNGEKINNIVGVEGENRSVLHTAMRDFFDGGNKDVVAKEAAQLAYAEVEKLRAFIKKGDAFTDIIHIGIGGSSLGPKAIYVALEYLAKKKVYFVSNVDPDNVLKVLRQVDLKKTLVVLVSKSGTTPESFTNEYILREAFNRENIDAKEHIVAVTGKGSPMDDPKRYLESFYIWDYVGGRYSVTSMVGAVTLSLALGMDNFMDILRGANRIDKMVLDRGEKNLPLMAALLGIWNNNFLNYSTEAIIPYSYALSSFVDHLQQCDMESNGKMLEKSGKYVDFVTGPIIWGGVGTDVQHSFFQLLHQGSHIVPVEFIGFSEGQYDGDVEVNKTTSQQKLLANMFAQACALALGKKDKNLNKVFNGNRPSSILLMDKLTPFNMGALLAYYEHKVVFQGFIWNINSFDQEGVQLGKVLADKFLSSFIKDGNFLLAKGFIESLR